MSTKRIVVRKKRYWRSSELVTPITPETSFGHLERIKGVGLCQVERNNDGKLAGIFPIDGPDEQQYLLSRPKKDPAKDKYPQVIGQTELDRTRETDWPLPSRAQALAIAEAVLGAPTGSAVAKRWAQKMLACED